MTPRKCAFVFGAMMCLICGMDGRGSATPRGSANLYERALAASIEEMARAYGHIDDSYGGEFIRTDYRHLVVEKNEVITDDFARLLGEREVEYLDHRDLVTRARHLRKPFAILVGRPMVNEGSWLVIIFEKPRVSYKRGTLRYAMSDWSTVYIRYECDPVNDFIIDHVTLGGT